MSSHDVMDGTSASHAALQSMPLDQFQPRPVTKSVGRSVDWSRTVDDQLEEKNVIQISGAGHWFLEGWTGDHSVDFLVDSGSAVTAVSCSFYKALAKAGAPVGALRPTPRKLRGANGSQIDILGCSSCMVSFLGLRTEFPILVCDLSTDAIIGTDTLGSVLLWILSMDCCSRREECPFSCTAGMLHCPDVCLLWVIVRLRHTRRRSCIVPLKRWVAGRCRPVACWRA